MSVFCSVMLFKSINASISKEKSKDKGKIPCKDQEILIDVQKICDCFKVERGFGNANSGKNDIFS